MSVHEDTLQGLHEALDYVKGDKSKGRSVTITSEKPEKIGTFKIADDVIAICAATATLRTEGVADFSPVFADNFSKSILGKDPLYKGVKVSQGDDGIAVDIFIIVKYGVKIPAVAWDIQENVKKEIEDMTESKVKAVNIHVQGVHMEGEEPVPAKGGRGGRGKDKKGKADEQD